jgi:hypothetical protein
MRGRRALGAQSERTTHEELAVLHYDADFDHIARITGQRCEWVVEAGSID